MAFAGRFGEVEGAGCRWALCLAEEAAWWVLEFISMLIDLHLSSLQCPGMFAQDSAMHS